MIHALATLERYGGRLGTQVLCTFIRPLSSRAYSMVMLFITEGGERVEGLMCLSQSSQKLNSTLLQIVKCLLRVL